MKVLSKPSDMRGISALWAFWEELLPILRCAWASSLAPVLVSGSMAGELRAMKPSCVDRLGGTGACQPSPPSPFA